VVGDLRRPTRRGVVEVPRGKDKSSPRPEDACDLCGSPRLIREEPERVDAHDRVEARLGQASRIGVPDQESGVPAQS
jgi:hypothetical protein